MIKAPDVSIVIPLFNDEDYVEAALDSCLAQTLGTIEIICVDDASTDNTVSLVKRYAAVDPRIKLIQQPANASAFQARRVGIMAASAPFILFLDGDDQLAPRATEAALYAARRNKADVVGFGVSIVAPNEGFPTRFEAALQPQHQLLVGPDIISSLFAIGKPANGHLWRYCFATSLLRAAYHGFPEDLAFYRANDLPITFLALAQAKKYVSIPDHLYRYHFRRGTSGHAIRGIEYFGFLLTGIDPITSIGPAVNAIAREHEDPDTLLACYASVRLSVIGHVLRYCVRDTAGKLQNDCITALATKVTYSDAVRAAASFCSEALHPLATNITPPSQPARVRNVLLTTSHLETGGLQAVLLEHVNLLRAHGYRVTIAVLRSSERDVTLPADVDVVEVKGEGKLGRIDHWLEICRQYEIDVVVDHHILYNENWPWFALAALTTGIPTIGWIHSFSLRPLHDDSQRTSFLTSYMRILLRVVTLSPTDVAFWKLHGIERVVYLPNPATTLARDALIEGGDRKLNSARIELAWWGRLDRSTKQVGDLVEVASLLDARGLNFRLTIVGPDSRNLTAKDIRTRAEALGVGERIDLLGEQNPQELLETLRNVDLHVSASAIEGYQLTIIEAQALGIPVVMYSLPWLETAQENRGLVPVEASVPSAMADAIVEIVSNPDEYQALSRESRVYAQNVLNIDLATLLSQLLTDDLPPKYSHAPTTADAAILIPQMVRYAERNSRGGRRGRAQLEAELKAARQQREHAKSRLRQIEEGPSFRIGRVLTFLPRKTLKALSLKAKNRSQGLKRDGAASLQASGKTPPPPLVARSAPPSRIDEPDVTVVIPVYNSEAWVADCVSSVLAQTGVDLEVICINDGSTDGSPAILRKFAAVDSRVTIIDQENRGQSLGRNVGLEHAKGRYIIFLDSDDYWPHDMLASLVEDADRDSLDVLLFDCLAFRDGAIEEKTWKWYSTYYQRSHTYREVRSGPELMAAMRRGGDYKPHVGLYMTRTEHVRTANVTFIPGIVHQDNPYTFRLLLNAQRAGHKRTDAYARRIRPGSTITTLKPERSATGYFLSYLEMSRELEGHSLERTAAGPISDIVKGVYDGARKQFGLISDGVAAKIGAMDTGEDAQMVFEALRENRELGE